MARWGLPIPSGRRLAPPRAGETSTWVSPARPEAERALRALAESVGAPGGVAVLVGARGFGKSAVLAGLERSSQGRYEVARLSAGGLDPDELAARILARLGRTARAEPQRALLSRGMAARESGRRLLLLLDGVDALRRDASHLLTGLLDACEPGVRLVLACEDPTRHVGLLLGAGRRLDVVCLREPLSASERAWLVGPAPQPAPVRPPRPGAVARRRAPRRRHRRTGLPLASGLLLAAVLAGLPLLGRLAPGPASAPEQPDAARVQRAGAPVSRGSDLVGTGRPSPRTASAGADPAAAAPRPDPEAESRARSAERVARLRQALDGLVEDHAPATYEDAIRTLAAIGPHPEGRRRLAALESRQPADRLEAMHLASARARLRSALCTAWGPGAAPGCPPALARAAQDLAQVQSNP